MNLIRQQMQRLFLDRVKEEQEAGHLLPVDLSEWQPGSPKLEALYASMDKAKREAWPTDLTWNM